MSEIDVAELKRLAQAALDEVGVIPGAQWSEFIGKNRSLPAAVLALMARLEAAEEHAKTQHERVEFILKDNERFQAQAAEHAEARRNAEASEAALLERVEFKEGELVASRTKAFEAMQALNRRIEALARAALLAFEYIDDRSAGSSEAWNALASALGMDPEEADVSEMVTALRPLAVTSVGR